MTATDQRLVLAPSECLFTVTIEGISPLLMHAFPIEAQQNLPGMNPQRSSMKTEADLPRIEAEKVLYTDNDGNPVLPAANLYKSIIEAGTFHKMGKKQLSTRDSSLIPGGMWIMEHLLPITPPDWEVETRPVTNQNTKGKVISHRPRFDKWSVTFTVRCDTKTIGKQMARMLIDDAGCKIGVCSFRPACKGPFGRFAITNWEELPKEIPESY